MEFEAGGLVKQITLRVTIKGMRRWNVRLWLALLLIRLGAWVAGLGGVGIKEEN